MNSDLSLSHWMFFHALPLDIHMHPSHPAICGQDGVSKCKICCHLSLTHLYLSRTPHPPILLDWRLKGMGLGHGGPVSWIRFVLLDHRGFAHMFPAAGNVLHALLHQLMASRFQLKHHLLKEASSGLPD